MFARRAVPLATIVWALIVLVGCGSGSSTHASSASAPVTAGLRRVSGLIDIGGRSLFLDCRGTRGPTIVLEAGMGESHSSWDLVRAGLGPDLRVCAYDRAGVATSDSAPKPRTVNAVVDDLRTLLAKVGDEPPYVLVGFSLGGLYSQTFAARYPHDVAAIVLVDSVHPTRPAGSNLT